ncbi:D-alanyl-D-alanine carboxypeptidase [Clostridiales bacterium TF09-2AC]|uniref:D-alanyl-D-alanine carboxypeptidase family protein n=1 Tax=Enterocloster hominis (ex Hitch et al. 2024) TaxID=1917870 RepID=UPI000E760D04|nr:D-alanyl-D-alanine carboxypeptidase family protein [Lachnoclostridium pacaense]RJW32791.1 D-alanyl-D-alanine carboxypeptidase [Clostridiales bacterium TF09-2AC]
MKRLFPLFLCLCLSMGVFTIRALAAPEWPSDVSIQADGGIVMDADTGTVLYGKNMDQQYYPASITKILTALIVLERCDLDEMVSFSHDDVYNVEAGSSSAGIDEGDVLTVRDCLYALMLASANESANALACHVSGSREEFAKLMNEKAASLGCTGSHFANPSGLNDENHYTTAHDMALIAREAIKNPEFLAINGTRSYKLAPTKRTPEGGYVANHHKMLNKNESVYYPGAFAGKTGYTSLAGNTLVTCAKKDGMTLIAVVLNGHQSHYSDTKAMFDFAFRNFQSLKAVDYETQYRSVENDMTIAGMTARDSISLELDKNGRVVIPKSGDFADVKSTLTYDLDSQSPSDAVACIRYTYNERPVGFVYLCSAGIRSDARTATPADAGGIGGPVPDGAHTPSQDGAGNPSPAANPASRDQTPAAPTRQDITTKEGTASSIRIPANTLTILGIVFSLCVIIAIVAAVKIHVKRKEEADLLLRRQRRLERLEDIGYSSSEFDRLLAERRVSSPSTRKTRRSRRKKSIFR